MYVLKCVFKNTPGMHYFATTVLRRKAAGSNNRLVLGTEPDGARQPFLIAVTDQFLAVQAGMG
jgi:hypothetical protein